MQTNQQSLFNRCKKHPDYGCESDAKAT